MRMIVFRSLIFGAALLVQTAIVRAAGEEFSRQAADFVLTVDSRWAGCGHGGYYPLRFKVANRGVERTLSFVFSGQGSEPLPTVRRSISVAQNSTAHLTLSIPLVGNGSYGTLNVYQDGRLIKQFTETFSLPDNQQYGTPRPALLVISTTNVDADAFESAVNSINSSAGASSPYGYYGSVAEDHAVVGPETLPDSWIDYSGLDLVALSLKTLGKLSNEQRAAILKWTQCGGNLIVYDVGEPGGQSAELPRLLNLNGTNQDSEWEAADLAHRTFINVVTTDEFGNVVPQAAANPSTTIVEQPTVEFAWPGSDETFARRAFMLGHVYAFPENPFPGSPHDWAWFLKSLPESERSWTARHGLSARTGSDEFLKFLIPSVKGVPVIAFLLLITAFTIVIGPLNYLWLWKKRHLYLLVVTIPAIALCTSLALFGYSAVAHGFSTKSRARTFTLLDQNQNTAVSVSRIALYAGLAPSGGLQFSPETAVYPLWPEGGGFQSGAVDWTDRQTLTGWLRSRTRTQYLTVSHRDERGRLRISAPTKDNLSVENGLEWGLESLIVSDESGQLYYGEDIDAGAAAELTPMTDDQRQEFVKLLEEYPLTPPQVSGNSGDFFDWGFNRAFMYGGTTPVRYAMNLAEKRLESLKLTPAQGDPLENETNTYAAIVRENPGIEFGIEKTRPQASLHVLVGRY